MQQPPCHHIVAPTRPGQPWRHLLLLLLLLQCIGKNDDEEMFHTEGVFNVIWFSEQEKLDCYLMAAGVMTCSRIEFKTRGGNDRAECGRIGLGIFPGKAANLMIKIFCKPRFEVGTV